MLFYIFLCAACLGIVLVAIAIPVGIMSSDNDAGLACFSFGLLFGGVLSIPVFVTWSGHSDDLGTIIAQQEVVTVYEKQRDDLNKTMEGFNYPAGSLMNADSPVRSIVEQLASVEKLLADARAEKAEAIKSIEQRRKGPMSGVISFVGDYK